MELERKFLLVLAKTFNRVGQCCMLKVQRNILRKKILTKKIVTCSWFLDIQGNWAVFSKTLSDQIVRVAIYVSRGALIFVTLMSLSDFSNCRKRTDKVVKSSLHVSTGTLSELHFFKRKLQIFKVFRFRANFFLYDGEILPSSSTTLHSIWL